MSTNRLRETDALPLTPEEVSQYKKWTTLGPNFSLSTHEQRRLLATIERQGNAIEDLELRLHQTNDAHALSCSEHLKALTEIERQGKALRAVEKELDSMDEMAKMSVPPEYHNVARWLRAALSQTEPQTADEAKENPS